MEHQDWGTVIIKKTKPAKLEVKSNVTVNQALRTGTAEIVKKVNASGNKTSTAIKSAVKLENETEELSHERVSSDLKRKIQQARISKKMTQAELAQAINEKPNVIQEYESGKAIPNQQVIAKLSRILGISLSQKPKPSKK